ncbi:unnamed protein product [Pleuronectes platessa]|uniref:Uncharacterized protein n=1 Tax=Pleuronectes platessa TaxID=8262 RepID=A0A9N7UIW8_PLEPL|nr:unnamed protein product [Pleuronectes platessa]
MRKHRADRSANSPSPGIRSGDESRRQSSDASSQDAHRRAAEGGLLDSGPCAKLIQLSEVKEAVRCLSHHMANPRQWQLSVTLVEARSPDKGGEEDKRGHPMASQHRPYESYSLGNAAESGLSPQTAEAGGESGRETLWRNIVFIWPGPDGEGSFGVARHLCPSGHDTHKHKQTRLPQPVCTALVFCSRRPERARRTHICGADLCKVGCGGEVQKDSLWGASGKR